MSTTILTLPKRIEALATRIESVERIHEKIMSKLRLSEADGERDSITFTANYKTSPDHHGWTTDDMISLRQSVRQLYVVFLVPLALRRSAERGSSLQVDRDGWLDIVLSYLDEEMEHSADVFIDRIDLSPAVISFTGLTKPIEQMNKLVRKAAKSKLTRQIGVVKQTLDLSDIERLSKRQRRRLTNRPMVVVLSCLRELEALEVSVVAA